MLEHFLNLFKHSAVYSIGNIATKAIGLILLPIYTKYLSLHEFGNFAIIDITIVIFVEILVLGQNQAIIMIKNSNEFENKDKSSFFTIVLFVALLNVLVFFIFQLSIANILNVFILDGSFYLYSKIAIGIIFFRVINNLFTSKLRADEKSTQFTLVTIVKLIVILFSAIYFLTYLEMKIDGILYAYLIGDVVLTVIILPSMLAKMEMKFDRSILYQSLIFGFPLVFNALPAILLNLSDRYILLPYVGSEGVGLYDLGYRFAGILNMFVILPFNLAVMPIVYKIYNTPGDKEFFKKLLLYLTSFLLWIGLGISMFGKELLQVITFNEEFVGAYIVIPIITLSYVFSGMRLVAVIGTFVKKKTAYIALSTILATSLNIILNIITIPEYGMISAAYNTLFSFFILYVISNHLSNKYYLIKYDYKKIIFLFFIAILAYLISLLSSSSCLLIGFILKIILLIIFLTVIILTNFVNRKNRNILFKMMEKISK